MDADEENFNYLQKVIFNDCLAVLALFPSVIGTDGMNRALTVKFSNLLLFKIRVCMCMWNTFIYFDRGIEYLSFLKRPFTETHHVVTHLLSLASYSERTELKGVHSSSSMHYLTSIQPLISFR